MRFAGELAALGTAVSWAVSSNIITAGGRRIGSLVLNRLRITLACVFLGIALLIVKGSPWPTWATPTEVALLAVSGLIGFVFGDAYGFRALVILGPGRGALLASTSPLFTALIAIPLLHEMPGPLALLGMALTLGGIYWVLVARERTEQAHVEGSARAGVVYGLLGAVGQAVGYVISKLALRSGIDPLSATMVRVVAAAIGVWLLAAFQHEVGPSLRALRDRRASLFMVGAATFGPFFGVTLSLIALRYIEAGVAASITAIYPVLTFLIASRAHGERLTARVLAGSAIAAAGVIVLFLR